MPAKVTKGVQCAWPQYDGSPFHAAPGLSWTTVITGGPTVSILLEGSVDDVDGHYATVDTSTAGAGETRVMTAATIAGLKFFRVKVSITSGGSSPKCPRGRVEHAGS